MTIDKTLREIKRMLEQAEREGYQRGWKDAAQSIVSSAQSLSGPAAPAAAKPKSTKRRTGKRVRRVVDLGLRFSLLIAPLRASCCYRK